MLGKLIKYDMKAIARIMVPLYAAFFVVSLGTKLVFELDSGDSPLTPVFQLASGLFTFLYVITIIGITAGCLIVIIMRFYRNFMTDEGYLAFTLPVSATAHLTSKILTAAIWVLFTVISIILSVALLLAGQIKAEVWQQFQLSFQNFSNEFGQQFGISGTAIWICIIALMLLSFLSTLITIYMCICVGQIFQGHRIIGAFAVYFGVYLIEQIIFCIPLFLLAGKAFATGSRFTLMSSFQALYWFFIVLISAFTVISFLVTRYFLNKKLNLE